MIRKNGNCNKKGLVLKMLEIIFIIVIIILFKLPEWRFDNYMPPNGYEIDHNEMSKDRIANNLTKDQVMSNTVNGKYNKRKKLNMEHINQATGK